MKKDAYFNVVETFSDMIHNLSSEMNNNSTKLDKHIVFYGLYGLPETLKHMQKNNYHLAKNKNSCREECLKKMRLSFDGHPRYRNHQDLIMDSLGSGSLTFENTIFNLPSDLDYRISLKIDKYEDGRQILIEILSFWQLEFLRNIKPEEHKEALEQNKTTHTNKTGLPSHSISAKNEDQYWKDREAARYDTSYYEDTESYLTKSTNDDQIEFDDDGSNWAYNERHDK